ncbi:Na/Pi symporter [Chondrinema litorale]|uniref:Na/Pi symporter n=1 Tax=Chondrinema litorale TaxID=2994555 RepID=UPI003D6EEB6E
MSNAFSLLSQDVVKQIIIATSNPFVGFFIGILTTAIIQSSSTVTSLVVAIVAAGTISLDSAIPIVMGANIGTTVTSTIVSLGYISKKKEFKKALAAAALHDFFNIFTVIILLPLQYFTGFLSYVSKKVSLLFYIFNLEQSNFFSYNLKPVSTYIYHLFGNNPFLVLGLAFFLLFYSIRSFTNVIKDILIGDSRRKMNEFIFGSPLKALGMGTLFTAALQSSSVTTSFIVPLAATNKITLKQAFPFIMGANVGTTVTALIAAFSTSETAVNLAVSHLVFNLIGVLMLYPIKSVRYIPVYLAKKMGVYTIKNWAIGFSYLILTFFLIPFLLILIFK